MTRTGVHRIRRGLAIVLLGLVAPSLFAAGGLLVSELSEAREDIGTLYTGDRIHVFGALSEPAQVIVRFVSPLRPVAIVEKRRLLSFWLDAGKYQVRGTPSLYYLLSSAPVDEILPESEQRRYGLWLGSAVQEMQVSPPLPDPAALAATVIRLRRERGDYRVDPAGVEVVQGRLVSANIPLPGQIALGTYRVETYVVRGGRVVEVQRHAFEVEEVGAELWVSRIASGHPWLFGMGLVLTLMVLGLLLGIVTTRGGRREA